MPTSPTVIPAIATPPSIANPANFDALADASWNSLPAAIAGMNAAGTVTFNNATESAAAAAAAAANAVAVAANTAAVASYANAAAWVSAGNYAVQDIRYSPADRRLYKCTATATGRTVDPSLDGGFWAPLNTERPLYPAAGTTQTMLAGCDYEARNVAATAFTLPASPTSGDPAMTAWLENGLTTNTFNPGANTVNGVAGIYTHDIPFTHPTFRFLNGTWRIKL